jgi:hypothetical protein
VFYPTIMPYIFIIVTIILVFLSVLKRIDDKLYRGRSLDKWPTNPTYFSEGLVNLVGTAGGIYIAIVSLITFLEIELPARIAFFGIRIEPMAGISLVIAIFQPYIMSIYHRFTLLLKR